MKAKIITIANNKGGVAKTTSTETLGVILSGKGYKTLLVDLDAQRNLTTNLLKGKPEKTLFNSILERETPSLYPVRNNLYLVPSSEKLSGAEIQLSGEMEREFILKDILEPLRKDFDFILLDCPPSLGLLTINSLVTSDYVLIPSLAETRSAEGLTTLTRLITQVKGRLNPSLSILGVFLTRWNRRRINKAVENYLRSSFGETVLATKIRENSAISESPTEGKTVIEYDPESIGAQDYNNLANEILSRLGMGTETKL